MTSQDLLIDLQVSLEALKSNVAQAYVGVCQDCHDIASVADDDDPILDKMQFRADSVRHVVSHVNSALKHLEDAIYACELQDGQDLDDAAFNLGLPF